MFTVRQTEIIDRSIEIIATKGIQGLTIKNLSKEIGISEPAIYRHFKSKTEIILAILENFKIMADFLSATMGNLDGTAYEKINFMFSKMMEVFTAQPSIVSVIFSEEIFKNEVSLLEKIRTIMNLHQKTIENIITKGQKDGNVRNDISTESLAIIIMGALRLLVKRWNLNEHNFDLNKEGKTLLDSIQLIIA
jgi:AcrR family transcriptional regulator